MSKCQVVPGVVLDFIAIKKILNIFLLFLEVNVSINCIKRLCEDFSDFPFVCHYIDLK